MPSASSIFKALEEQAKREGKTGRSRRRGVTVNSRRRPVAQKSPVGRGSKRTLESLLREHGRGTTEVLDSDSESDEQEDEDEDEEAGSTDGEDDGVLSDTQGPLESPDAIVGPAPSKRAKVSKGEDTEERSATPRFTISHERGSLEQYAAAAAADTPIRGAENPVLAEGPRLQAKPRESTAASGTTADMLSLQEENAKLKELLRGRDRRLQWLIPSLSLFEMDKIMNMASMVEPQVMDAPVKLLLGRFRASLDEAVDLLEQSPEDLGSDGKPLFQEEERTSALSIARAMMTQLTQWIVSNYADIVQLDTQDESGKMELRAKMIGMLNELADRFKQLFESPDLTDIMATSTEDCLWDSRHTILHFRSWQIAIRNFAPDAANAFGELADTLIEDGYQPPSEE